MNYYNLEKISKSILIELSNKGQEAYGNISPFKIKNFKSDRESEMMFSKNNVYISEKEFFFQFLDFQDELKNLGCKVDLSKVSLKDSKLTQKMIEKEKHFIDYKGALELNDLKTLRKRAEKELKINPYYSYFKNLNEMKSNRYNCVSIDFEFSPIHGPTEMGATYYENGKLTTKWYRVKDTPNRNKPSHYNKEAEIVKLEDLKEVLKIYHRKFETFIFHDYMAEKRIIERMFNGKKGTPFDGEKKVLDTLRAAQYIRQRDEEYNNSGFNDTLEGLCRATNVKASGFHNAANDTRFTFNVARKLSKKYEKLLVKCIDEDIKNPKIRAKKIHL
jgi:hypothetical protein